MTRECACSGPQGHLAPSSWRDQVFAQIGRTRSHVDKGITAATKMSVMKFVTCVRWCLIAIIATSFAACATQNGGRDHTESKDYGWHRTKWINT